MKYLHGLYPIVLTLALSGPVLADDVALDGLSITGEIGLTNIQASEFVFRGPVQISRLDWQTRAAVVASTRFIAGISARWSLKGSASISIADLGGDMTDRDWLYRNDTGPSGPDDWTHWSNSPETKLDHFIQAGLEADRQLVESGDLAISAGPGFKFTNVQWTAWGGNYVYSEDYDSFRNLSGTLSSNQKGITYQQSVPVVYLGVNAHDTIGGLTISGSLRGGASVGMRDTDHHFLRNLDFNESLSLAPFAGADLEMSYAIDPITDIFASASGERVFFARGDTKEMDTTSGNVTSFPDSSGASLQTVSLSAGFKRRF